MGKSTNGKMTKADRAELMQLIRKARTLTIHGPQGTRRQNARGIRDPDIRDLPT
jgi:hypothetical protein